MTLLEQVRRRYGASGRNPGFVWLHCRDPGWALDVSFAGRALYDKLARDPPVPFEFRADGGLIYFTDERQAPVFEQFVAARRADGLDLSLIDNAEVRSLVGPIRLDVLGASFCANDAQINTATVVNALMEGAIAEGATVHEGVTAAQLIHANGGIVGVESTAGTFLADTTVIASCRWCRPPRCRGRSKPVVYGPATAKQYTLFRSLPAWDSVLGLFVAAGHVFGNSSGPMTGKLVSQLLPGKTPEIDMSEVRYGHDLDPIVPGQIVHW